MNFKYGIPTHICFKSGGDLESKKILLSDDVRGKEFKFFKKEDNIIYIGEYDVYQMKINITLCWVLCDVLL